MIGRLVNSKAEMKNRDVTGQGEKTKLKEVQKIMKTKNQKNENMNQ